MKRWSVIKGHHNYEISEYGDCRNVSSGKVLNKRIKNRRVNYSLSHKGIQKHVLAHRMVAFAFVPLVEGKNDINHIDGNPLNNYYKNLEWCTKKENSQHSFDNKLQVPKYKITPCQALYIREFYGRKRGSVNELSSMFSVSRRTIRNIILNINRKTKKW